LVFAVNPYRGIVDLVIWRMLQCSAEDVFFLLVVNKKINGVRVKLNIALFHKWMVNLMYDPITTNISKKHFNSYHIISFSEVITARCVLVPMTIMLHMLDG
jgi:hypothetical protein